MNKLILLSLIVFIPITAHASSDIVVDSFEYGSYSYRSITSNDNFVYALPNQFLGLIDTFSIFTNQNMPSLNVDTNALSIESLNDKIYVAYLNNGIEEITLNSSTQEKQSSKFLLNGKYVTFFTPNSNSNKLYVNIGGFELVSFDLNSNQIDTSYKPGSYITDVTFNQDTNHVYLIRANNQLVQLDGDTLKEINMINLDSSQSFSVFTKIFVDAETNYVYALNPQKNILVVANANDYSILDTIQTGSDPRDVVVTSSKIFVSNYEDDTVLVYDKKNHSILESLSVESNPTFMELTNSGKIYLLHHFKSLGQSISVIQEPIAPEPPSTFVISGMVSGTVSMNWSLSTNSGTSPVIGYQIERMEEGQKWKIIVPSIDAFDYVDSNLKHNQKYYYRISAVSDVGASLPSISKSVVVVHESPDSPVLSYKISNEDVIFSWTVPFSGGSPISTYVIESASQRHPNLFADGNMHTKDNSYTLKNHSIGYSSFYRVIAFNENSAASDPSNVIEVFLHPSSGLPNWLKFNAKLWSEGSITDKEFATVIGFMLQKGHVTIPGFEVDPNSTFVIKDPVIIPSWVKENAGWWYEGGISDLDFISSIEFLINEQIIKLGSTSKDSDNDGINDDVDSCPTQPETVNGYQDTDGCPDSVPVVPKDSDNDGINDDVDSCPTQPETVNGYQDTDGCPDSVPVTVSVTDSYDIAGSCNSVHDGLVSWYDGESNSVVYDVQGLNDADAVNGVGVSNGVIGNGFTFDGIDDHIIIPSNSDLNFGTDNFAISTWVKTDFIGGNANDFLVTKSSSGNDVQYTLGYRANSNGQIWFAIQDPTSGELAWAESDFSIADNKWHHVAGIRDGMDIRLYVDGQLSATASSSFVISTTSDNDIVIGGRLNPSNNPYLNGHMDEVEFYNRSLSQSEVQTIYDSGSTGKCSCMTPPSNLVAWWDADSVYATTATDIQSGITGELKNGVKIVPGKVGNAFSFDGVDDHILIIDNSKLDFDDDDFTLDAWIKTSFIGGNAHDMILTKTLGGADVQYALAYRANADGHMRFMMQDPQTNELALSDSGFSIADGQWHHVAGVRENTEVRLYVDGQIVSTGVTNYSIPATSDNNVVIGGRENISNNPFFNGLIDEVEIFDRALTDQEIKNLFESDTYGKCKPLN